MSAQYPSSNSANQPLSTDEDLILVGNAIIIRAFPCLPPPRSGARLKGNVIGLVQFSPLPAAAVFAQTTPSGPLSALMVMAALMLSTTLVWLLRHHVPATPIHHSPQQKKPFSRQKSVPPNVPSTFTFTP